jgi:hypothetical protein
VGLFGSLTTTCWLGAYMALSCKMAEFAELFIFNVSILRNAMSFTQLLIIEPLLIVLEIVVHNGQKSRVLRLAFSCQIVG